MIISNEPGTLLLKRERERERCDKVICFRVYFLFNFKENYFDVTKIYK
jgi:hypothetical protein